jgi:dipeptidyl aminopeptidase/acylaminoacyl peptidase
VPLGGGAASKIVADPGGVSRPRWSPDGTQLLYASNGNGERGLRVHTVVSGETQALTDGRSLDLHPAWHPDGDRIVFASDRRDSGLDIWEADIATGLQWRMSSRPGDETEPAWSSDGRDLAYIHRDGDEWALVLRRHGEPEEVLVSGSERLAGPSWRPDGSLVMFWRDGPDGLALDMVILSEPRLVRRYADGEEFTPAPVSWLDRHRMFYSADGVIRQRLFNAWSSRTVPFRARIQSAPERTVERVRRKLPRIDEPGGSLIIRAARLYDGLGGGYRRDLDIVIAGGRVSSVEAQRERPGQIVIDMGDLTILPGLVDVSARLPDAADESIGPLLLAAGVTTLVADHPEAEHLNRVWSGKELPGPRILPVEDWPVANTSGLADSQTPGLESVLDSRPARLLEFDDIVARRFGELQRVQYGKTSIVLGSRPSGMPAGIGTQAELRALVAAGLSPPQALHASGVNAAAALGVDPNLGRIASEAVADLLFVDGDPLARIDDTLAVVAVLRNGRFFSVAGLIDRAAAARTVE